MSIAVVIQAVTAGRGQGIGLVGISGIGAPRIDEVDEPVSVIVHAIGTRRGCRARSSRNRLLEDPVDHRPEHRPVTAIRAVGKLGSEVRSIPVVVFLDFRMRADEHGPSGAVVDPDHAGRAVTDESFRGRYLLIYFGYTFCPDVCPTELANIAVAIDELGDDGAQLEPVFISIDPERDTPEVIAEYVPLFHERLVGLTGSADQIEEVAKNYRVFYKQVVDESYTYYLMDHSSFTYLMGPDGEFVAMFRYGTPPEEMAEAIRQAMGT